MRSKKPFFAGKPTFAIFIMFLLASAIVPTQAQAQKFKVLHTFHGPNGAQPVGGLIRDAAGNIYGTTGVGGSGNCSGGTGCGTAFKLDKSGKQVKSQFQPAFRDDRESRSKRPQGAWNGWGASRGF